ncbi:MAG: hypothetical protein KJ011_06575 [Burkholderiaceae bacterium]|nr:hypothetical protein [Burkholderiaceae bacterium]
MNSSPAEFCAWLAERGLIQLQLRVAPALVEPPPPPVRAGSAVDLLLDPVRVVDGKRVEPVVLRLRGRWLVGPAGREPISRALRLLLRACERPGEAVEHGYTVGSAERLLRAARAALRAVVGVDPVEGLDVDEATVTAYLWLPVRVVHDTDEL